MILMRGDLTEKVIAEVLRSGRADQQFLDVLAMMLDPPTGKKPKYRLELRYARSARPKSKTFDEAALVAELRELKARGLKRGEQKRQRALIETKHGIKRRTAQEAAARAGAADRLWSWVEALDAQVRK